MHERNSFEGVIDVDELQLWSAGHRFGITVVRYESESGLEHGIHQRPVVDSFEPEEEAHS